MRSRKLFPCLLTLTLVAFVGGPLGTAHANGKHKKNDPRKNHDDKAPTNDFAFFDGSNPLNQPDAGAICGASKGQPYTFHLAVANFGSDGLVRLTYHDGDFVQFPIAAGGSLSLSQAAGSKGGADRVVRVSNGGSAAQLAGTLSAENARCASCDADGGIGDAGCDERVAN